MLSGVRFLQFESRLLELTDAWQFFRHAGLLQQVAGQQATKAREAQEKAVVTKLDKVRLDQTRRADALAQEAEDAQLRVSACALHSLYSRPLFCALS